MELQARFWYEEGRYEEAKSEALLAVGAYEKVGNPEGLAVCRKFLQQIKVGMGKPVTPGGSDLGVQRSTVSPCKWCHFRRLLTFRSQFSEPNDGAGDRLSAAFLQTYPCEPSSINTSSPPPPGSIPHCISFPSF